MSEIASTVCQALWQKFCTLLLAGVAEIPHSKAKHILF
jgi:hypothetical protein